MFSTYHINFGFDLLNRVFFFVVFMNLNLDNHAQKSDLYIKMWKKYGFKYVKIDKTL